MFSLTDSQFQALAAACTVAALATPGTSTRADEMVQNLGPVGLNEPILATVGNKRLVAFCVPANGTYSVRAVVWNSDDVDAGTAMRLRVALTPGEKANIDSGSEPLSLLCGEYDGQLAVVHTDHLAALGTDDGAAN
jgi:hypothetical protein